MNRENKVSNKVKVIKEILNGLIENMDSEAVSIQYDKYKDRVEERNTNITLKISGIEAIKQSKEKVATESSFYRHILPCTVLQMIMKTKYSSYMVDMTLEELGYILGLTRERIRQLELSAIRRIKAPAFKDKIIELRDMADFIESMPKEDYTTK